MAFTTCSVATNNIASLDDLPNDVGGLTAAQLKAVFDKFGADFVAWFNATHIVEADAHLAENAAHGATASRTASKILLRDANGNAPANGLSFPSTQVSSTDANTLDDYEEGTFTPTAQGGTSAGVGTYNYQVGNYTKIGNMVQFELFIAWSAHTGTGSLAIAGLPFAAVGAVPPASITAGALTFTGQLVAYVNGSVITLLQMASNSELAAIDMDTSVSEIRISGSYRV